MKRLILTTFLIVSGMISSKAKAVSIDISKASFEHKSTQNFILNGVKLSAIAEPVSVEFRWNSQTDAFDAYQFSTGGVSNPGILGDWKLTWMMTGAPYYVTPLAIRNGGTCSVGVPSQPCTWTLNGNNFALVFTDYVLTATYNGGLVNGTVKNNSGTVVGAWSAAKSPTDVAWRSIGELEN